MRLVLLVSALVVLAVCTASFADLPGTMSYQGVLRDDSGDIVPDGDYSLTFRIYTVSSGGSAVWQETQSVGAADGVFDVVLGGVTPLSIPFDVPYWLGVSVEGQAELAPRTELTPAPYAHRAGMADAVEGGSGDTDWVESGGDIYRETGRVGIGVTSPWKSLHVRESVAGDISYAIKLENPGGGNGTSTGILFKVDSSNEDRGKGGIVYERTTTWNRGRMHFLQNNSGNADRASLADVAMTIANNRNVGIGTTTPGAKLEVASQVRVTGFSWPATGRGLEIGYNDTQNKGYVFAYDRDLGQYGDLALGSGNVGIGTNYPAERLHVNGTIYSASGGFKFPDGTVQTTAGGGGGGGLVLPYAGTASTTAAAFSATNTDAYGEGVQGTHTPTGSFGYLGTPYGGAYGYDGASYCYGYVGYDGAGLYGVGYGSGTGAHGSATTGYGVYGNATSGTGVYGRATQSAGFGVAGVNEAASTLGRLGTELAGAYGEGAAYGVHGVSFVGGYAVYGVNAQGTAIYGVTSTGSAVQGYSGASGYAGDFQGNVRVRSISSGETIIEFGEGLDYAEGFDVSESEKVASGTVLIIDPDSPGELAVSTRAYDTRVAGIVAGANGLGSAVRLGVDRYDLDVALAGRVYCNVDAASGPVAPGDLLTTSGTPGFAMKATDAARAHGAVLGKAMEPLAAGEQGQILVLVTLH